MIALLIGLLVTVVGKFHAREPVAPLPINTQAVIISLNRTPVGITGINRELQPPLLRASTAPNISGHNSLQQPFHTDEEIYETILTTRISDMSSHKPQRTATEDVRNKENSTQPTRPDVPKSPNEENKETTDKTTVNINGTEVSFDERSAFSGDQCPTGYVRVNGKCVEED